MHESHSDFITATFATKLSIQSSTGGRPAFNISKDQIKSMRETSMPFFYIFHQVCIWKNYLRFGRLAFAYASPKFLKFLKHVPYFNPLCFKCRLAFLRACYFNILFVLVICSNFTVR